MAKLFVNFIEALYFCYFTKCDHKLQVPKSSEIFAPSINLLIVIVSVIPNPT